MAHQAVSLYALELLILRVSRLDSQRLPFGLSSLVSCQGAATATPGFKRQLCISSLVNSRLSELINRQSNGYALELGVMSLFTE